MTVCGSTEETDETGTAVGTWATGWAEMMDETGGTDDTVMTGATLATRTREVVVEATEATGVMWATGATVTTGVG